MNIMTRNRIFMKNEHMIKTIMNDNRAQLLERRLEWDDVYQELAVAALNAINACDPSEVNVSTYIWLRLQDTAQSILRRYKPCKPAVENMPWRCLAELPVGCPLAEPACDTEDAARERRLRKTLDKLEPQERRLVILYLEDGVDPETAQQRKLAHAVERFKELYLAMQLVTGGAV